MDVGLRSRLITTINPPRVILGPAPRSSITTTHPAPVVIVGLDPGIRRASAGAAEVVLLGASSVPNPFTGCPDAADPRVKPEDDAGEGGSARKILSPPLDTRAILPARCRQGRGCIRASGETDPGSLRVAAGKAQSGRMAGRGTRRSTSHSRKGEGHRREVGRESGHRFPGSPTDPLKMPISRTTNPSPRRRHKPKTLDAWGDDRFIY